MKASIAFLALIFLAANGAIGAEEEVQLKTYTFVKPSVIGFQAYTFLHDFKGETESLSGKFELDVAHLKHPGRGAIELKAYLLNTKNKKRDFKMGKEYLEVESYPLIRFVVREAILETEDDVQHKADYILKGELDLHGIQKEIQCVATLDYLHPERLKIEGQTFLKLTDFGILPPSFLKIFRMKDKVKVYFHLVAKEE